MARNRFNYIIQSTNIRDETLRVDRMPRPGSANDDLIRADVRFIFSIVPPLLIPIEEKRTLYCTLVSSSAIAAAAKTTTSFG